MKDQGQNKKIDQLLKQIDESGNYTFDSDEFMNMEKIEYNRMIFFMTEIGLLKQIDKEYKFLVVTKLGFDVISKGGWIKYLSHNNFKKIISLTKDLVLTIIPILSLLATIYIATLQDNTSKMEKNLNENTELTKQIRIELKTLKNELNEVNINGAESD